MKRTSFCLGLVAVVLLAGSLSASGFKVVDSGKAVAGFENRENSPMGRKAAQLLVKYLQKSTGAVLPAKQSGRRIVLTVNSSGLDIEGFKVTFPDADRMVLTGGSANGLYFAVVDFCERHLGIRFLFPGELGEYIPRHATLVISRKEYADAPKFLTRYLTNGNNHITRRPYQEWTPFMRGLRPYRLMAGHNLYNMFDFRKYGKTHPEFYPILNGKRYIPNRNVHWQPCLTNPAVVKHAVKVICDAFEKDPSCRAWSLAVTDGNGACECAECQKLWDHPEHKAMSGMPDRTRYFISFYNKVAEGVTARFPDAQLSFYAYGYLFEPPRDIKVHPALVPILTYDRLNWIDPERKAKDLKRHEGWAKVCSSVAWYDYLYGGSYFLLPRIYNHHIAKVIKTAYRLGVRHFFAEFFPMGVGTVVKTQDWYDGPKAYMTYKLLWNPDQDEDAILEEWYRAAVGEKAAPYLRKCDDLLEEFWTGEVRNTGWFARCARTYHVPTWHEYLIGFNPAVFKEYEKNMNEVCRLAEHKERAEYFRKLFLERRKHIMFWYRNQITQSCPGSSFSRKFHEEKFENGLQGWNHWEYRPKAGRIVSAAGEGRDSSKALKLEFTGGGDFGAEKTFLVEKPQNFEVTVWYRNVDIAPKGTAYVALEWEQGNQQKFPFYYNDVHGKVRGKWAKATCRTTCPDALDFPCRLKVRLLGASSKQGYILYDNLEIRSDLDK